MSAISRHLSFWDSALFDPISATMMAVSAVSAVAGAGSSLYGASVAAAGAKAAGDNAEALGKYQEEEANEQANEATALGQRKMLEQKRQGELVLSTLQARAAASGASATGDSTLKLSSDIVGRSEYESLMSLSSGESQSAGLQNQGKAARYQGDLTKSMAPLAAAGAWASGIGGAANSMSRLTLPSFGSGSGVTPPSPLIPTYAPDRPKGYG